ncbi:hypothetical protein Dimus_030793 [Dionaea muscipula]
MFVCRCEMLPTTLLLVQHPWPRPAPTAHSKPTGRPLHCSRRSSTSRALHWLCAPLVACNSAGRGGLGWSRVPLSAMFIGRTPTPLLAKACWPHTYAVARPGSLPAARQEGGRYSLLGLPASGAVGRCIGCPRGGGIALPACFTLLLVALPCYCCPLHDFK